MVQLKRRARVNAGKDERRTHLRTLRFPESLERSLEKEATDEGTRVNADVNSILNRHFNWDKKLQEFGVAEIPKSLLKSILEGCDHETLARIGREVGLPLWKEMAEFWNQDSSLDGMLDFQAARARFDPNFQTKVTQEGGTYTITIRHEYGPKWSIMAKSALQELVKQSFHVDPKATAGESVVTARFKVLEETCPSDRTSYRRNFAEPLMQRAIESLDVLGR